jgi:hypothetical protein
MSIRRSLTQNVTNILNEPYVVSGIQRPSPMAPSVSSSVFLKGLLGTLPPSDKNIPIPGYAFPKLKKIVEDLQAQLTNDNTDTLLWLDTDQYMFLKNLLVQIEQKISTRKTSKTNSYGVSLDVLLLLIGKLQKQSGKQQHIKLRQLLMVMDKFIAIEKCLIGKIESQQSFRDKLVYDLDVLFESFLIDVISSQEEWSPASIQNKLKRRLISVSENDLHPMIEQCSEEIPVGVIETRTNTSLYVKIRNELLLLCNEFGVQLPTPLTITMEYIRGASKLMCEHTISIENIIAVFVMSGYSKKNALLISGLIKFYCDMQKDAKMSSVTRFLLVLAQFKKSQEKQIKKQQGTYVSEALDFAKKAEKVVNKKTDSTFVQLLKMNQSLGLPLSKEDEEYLKQHAMSTSVSQRVTYATPRESRRSPSEKDKETEKENKIPIPRGPRANPYSLYGKYTSILGRSTNILDAGLIQSVKNMIDDFELEPITAGFLLTGFFALRRSFQIEGWNSLVRSYNYQLRSSLGEKLKGRRPQDPIKLLSSGRWGEEALEEKKVFLTLNRGTLISNIMLMGTTVYSYVTYKLLNGLGSDTSDELMKETIEETETESEPEDYHEDYEEEDNNY